ncbi:hypothetical protein C3L33_17659, partial [Rhododendron williamsianum]
MEDDNFLVMGIDGLGLEMGCNPEEPSCTAMETDESRTASPKNEIVVFAPEKGEASDECNSDELLKAEAGAKVQKFTQWALKCIGFYSRSQGNRDKVVQSSAVEIQLQLSAFKTFLDLAGNQLTRNDFTEAFDAACFPLTLFSSSFDPGWASGISATAIHGLLGMLVEGGADNVNQCFLEASRFGSTELVAYCCSKLMVTVGHPPAHTGYIAIREGFHCLLFFTASLFNISDLFIRSAPCSLDMKKILPAQQTCAVPPCNSKNLLPLLDSSHESSNIFDEIMEQFWIEITGSRNSLDVDVDLALGFASHYGKIDTMECLVEEGNAMAFLGPLMRAAETGCMQVVQWFVKRGCRDMELCLALTAATSSSQVEIASYLLPRSLNILLRHPAATYALLTALLGLTTRLLLLSLGLFFGALVRGGFCSKGLKEGEEHYLNMVRDPSGPLRVAIAYLALYRECVKSCGCLLSQRLRGQLVEAVTRLGNGVMDEAAAASKGRELLVVLEHKLPPLLFHASSTA